MIKEMKWLSGGRQQGKTYQLIKDQQKEIERLKAREEEISKMYLAGHKYASEMEGKYILAKYVIDELEKFCNIQLKVAETNIIESKKWLDVEEEQEHAKSDIHTAKIIKRYMLEFLDKIKELKEGKNE